MYYLFIYFRNKFTFVVYKNKEIMSEFFKTRMGRKFYDTDVPRLSVILEKIATQLQSLNEREEKRWRLDERLKKVELKNKLNEECGIEK